MFTLAEFTYTPSHRDSSSVIIWSCVMIVVIVVGFAIVLRVRKGLSEEEPPSGPSTGFTLSDLRKLHRDGQMSDEEFERAKTKIVAAARKAAERDAPAPEQDGQDSDPGAP